MKLMERTDKELQELAAKYELPKVKLPLTKPKRMELVEAIEKADVKMRMKVEAQARAEVGKEAEAKLKKLGLSPRKKAKPSPETLAIEKSKRKYYIFRNNEEEGVKVALQKGEKYRFELWDGRIHCLPVWLVDNLRKTATFPIYAQRKHPVSGLEYSALIGKRPRFGFDELKDAPDDTPFGVVIDHALEKEFLPAVA
jgi:hypothetical protein